MRVKRNNAALRWVASAALGHPSGHALSWLSQEHPGYPYPEISGYLLALLAGVGGHHERRASLVRALLAEEDGGAARGDVLYTFDTGMALNGLLLEIKSGNPAPPLAARAAAW